MRVLILNGSPRAERSNTLRIAKAFADGFSSAAEAETEIVHLYKQDIKPCIGCFSCWTKTPGKCVINDDMQALYGKIEAADVIIESFPLYFFGMPSGFKAAVDRCLPFMKTYLGKQDSSGGNTDVVKPPPKGRQDVAQQSGGADSFHELRSEAMFRKKLVLISTCGYVDTPPMYPALLKQYDLICGEGNYTAILCSEGELFGYEGLAERQKKGYLADVFKAGAEFAECGKLSPETHAKLSKYVLSPGGFEAIVRSHWGGEQFPQI